MSQFREELPGRASNRSGSFVVMLWLVTLVFAWTFFWMLINWAPSRGWLVLPVAVALFGVVITVATGNFLAATSQRRRIRRVALLATGVLSVWSFLAIIVTLSFSGHSWTSILAVVFFGSFVALIMALVGFGVVAALLWFGVRLAPIVEARNARRGNNPLRQRPSERTPVR